MKVVFYIVLAISLLYADPYIISDKGVGIILNEDGTWKQFDTASYIIVGHIIIINGQAARLSSDCTWSYLQTTEDSILLDSTSYWEGYNQGLIAANNTNNTSDFLKSFSGGVICSSGGGCISFLWFSNKWQIENLGSFNIALLLPGTVCGLTSGYPMADLLFSGKDVQFTILGKNEKYIEGYINGYNKIYVPNKRMMSITGVLCGTCAGNCVPVGMWGLIHLFLSSLSF